MASDIIMRIFVNVYTMTPNSSCFCIQNDGDADGDADVDDDDAYGSHIYLGSFCFYCE